jgi:hypothetical protein
MLNEGFVSGLREHFEDFFAKFYWFVEILKIEPANLNLNHLFNGNFFS